MWRHFVKKKSSTMLKKAKPKDVNIDLNNSVMSNLDDEENLDKKVG